MAFGASQPELTKQGGEGLDQNSSDNRADN